MKFGIDVKKKLTGARLYIAIFQISSILPIFFLFAVSGYPGILTKPGFLSVLFSLGLSSIPRAELAALSLLYRLSLSEIAVNFALLIIALALGFAAKKLFAPETERARTARIVFIVLIAADLVVRAVPLRLNTAFGTIPAIVGCAVRAFCLLLIIMDLRAGKAERSRQAEPVKAEAEEKNKEGE